MGSIPDSIVAALNNARVGLAISALDGDGLKTVHANDAALEIVGRTREELMASSPLSYLAPEELERVSERRARRLRGDPEAYFYDTVILRGDGQRIPISIGVSDVIHASVTFSVTILLEISERRRAEDALGRSEARFTQLIEAAPEPIAVVRMGRFAYVNPALVRVLGYDRADELISRPLSDILPPEEAELFGRRVRAMVTTGGRMSPQEYRGFRRDGRIVVVEVASIPIEYEGAPAILALARDVGERKQLEAQLLQANRMAAVGTVAASVAHEINNPLAYVSLNLSLLERTLPTLAAEPHRLQEFMEIVRSAREGIARITGVVRDLRSFSRAGTENLQLVDLRRVVESAIKMAAYDARHRATIVMDFEPDVGPVLGDESRMAQVFLNLLINAAQAIPEVSDGANEYQITVRILRHGHNAVVEVSDNGVGILPEHLGRIFEPFFTTKPMSVGTGLGLSVCHDLVQAMGGEITVSSVPGQQTTFRVILPESASSTRSLVGKAASSEAQATSAMTSARARILIIDDETRFALAFAAELERDHDVVVAASGHEALALLDRPANDFDVIFCDVTMPVMSGSDVLATLERTRPALASRLVFVTGGGVTARAMELLATSKNPVIAKPLDLETVRRLIRELAAGA